jgi:queuine tRNA-ribosyltransferase
VTVLSLMEISSVIEKKDPPIFKQPKGQGTSLHRFTSFPQDRTTIMAARRCPAVLAPGGNMATHITIFTSTGFKTVTVAQYAEAIKDLQPDIVIPLADLLHSGTIPAAKRQIKMADRTEEWVDEFLDHFEASATATGSPSVFAPLLPVEHPIQWAYLKHLAEEQVGRLAGLAVYDVNLLPELTGYAPLTGLPKLSVDAPRTPHQVLRQVALGVDMCTTPFVNSASDAGVALTFAFPPSQPPPAAEGSGGDGTSATQPLGVDMWPMEEHSTALEPLVPGCQCYACTRHHRAFVNHLLNAKEMLGWNLLQIHNHHVLDLFFQGIRETLGKDRAEFERSAARFAAMYDPELPAGTGERPRARGYHFKSDGGAAAQGKFNKPAWQDLDALGEQHQQQANQGPPVLSAVSGQEQVETPIEPEVDGKTLENQGFAQKQVE